MEDEEYISSELQDVITEFDRIKDTYVAMSTYCSVQEEVLALEKERAERIKENLEKLSHSYQCLDSRHKSIVEEFEKERKDLGGTIEKLTERCDHLHLVNMDRNDEQMYKLQDELEVLKAQLSIQEEKHIEEIARLRQQHSDEMQRYKMLLQTAKQNTTCSKGGRRGGGKSGSNSKRKESVFRWPELDIDKMNNSSIDRGEEIESGRGVNKKRKLYHEDEEAIDII